MLQNVTHEAALPVPFFSAGAAEASGAVRQGKRRQAPCQLARHLIGKRERPWRQLLKSVDEQLVVKLHQDSPCIFQRLQSRIQGWLSLRVWADIVSMPCQHVKR